MSEELAALVDNAYSKMIAKEEQERQLKMERKKRQALIMSGKVVEINKFRKSC